MLMKMTMVFLTIQTIAKPSPIRIKRIGMKMVSEMHAVIQSLRTLATLPIQHNRIPVRATQISPVD
jgi:hypothetical protein